MTCEKCFISTNILKGCNLTQHGSKRQIKMFIVRFTLGKNSFTCMTCEKCFISTNHLKGCNLTQQDSKRQIEMFMLSFTLGSNLSLVWHVKSVSSQPTFWKVVTWQNMVPKDKSNCSWMLSLVWNVSSVSFLPTFWLVVIWQNNFPTDNFKCSWTNTLWGIFSHL